MPLGLFSRSDTRGRPSGRSFFEELGRVLTAPIRLIKKGRLAYLGYLALLGGLLGVISITVHDLLSDEIARLFTTGAIQKEQFERMKFVIPSFVGILASPVVIALTSLPSREFRGDYTPTFGALIRLTPRAAVRSGSAMIALALYSFRLIIPLFLLGLGYLLARDAFGPKESLAGGVVIALCFIPSIWRFGTVLVAPIVAVISNTIGRAAIAESKQRGEPKLTQIWFVVIVGAIFYVGAIIGGESLGLSGYLRYGVLIILMWFFLTTLADLFNEAAPPPQG